MTVAAHQIALRHFGRKNVTALALKGIRVIGLQAIPDMRSSMPWADADTAYTVDDNGCSRVWTWHQVVASAEAR